MENEKLKELIKNGNEYGNKIFEMWNSKSRFNAAYKNYERIKRNGIEPNERFLVNREKKITCVVIAKRGYISKLFFWGKRYITEETARKKCNFVDEIDKKK